jgi:6-phosphogluconolactonase (cycloisomerase 2 family)
MKLWLGLFLVVALNAPVAFCSAGQRPAKNNSANPGSATYVITNDDVIYPYGNKVTFFLAGGTSTAPSLTREQTLLTGGHGIAGGFFGMSRLTSLPDSGAHCLYVSDGGSGDIAGIDLQTQQATGTFPGSQNDAGTTNGISLAMNANYLYASFTDSNTIGTFAVLPGCQLSFLSDTSAVGLNGGTINGMALSGNVLVVAYGDGSIESFNVSGGAPVSNGDEQNSTGYIHDYNNLPAAVDITRDGRYAIFGDVSVSAMVEVSDISSGKLTATLPYILGTGPTAVTPGINSSTVRLSPDESLLFVGNNQSGTISAAFFDQVSGKVSPGCISATLKGLYTGYSFLGALATENTSGTGGVLYVAEYFPPASSIGIIVVSSNGTTCTLNESSNSPTFDPQTFGGMLSIWVYPPRPF